MIQSENMQGIFAEGDFFWNILLYTQLAFACTELTVETTEQCVKSQVNNIDDRWRSDVLVVTSEHISCNVLLFQFSTSIK